MSQPHTPGPWKASLCENGIEADVQDAEGYFIATCMGGAGKDGAPNALYNANLIAAAPDLLDACMYIVQAGDNGDECTAIQKATAAIAKAMAGDL